MSRRPSGRPRADPVERVLRRARVAMGLESLVRAFWPLAAMSGALWAVAAFGAAEIASRNEVLAVLGLAGAVMVWLLVRGVRRFRWPGRAAARARLDATLPGHPFAALDDVPAHSGEDAGASGVWSVHLARMRARAAAARPLAADLRLARFDPWALRLVALVLVVAAGLFARDRAAETLTAALAPEPSQAVAAGPSFEGWAEPPAYTGRPTLYLPEVSGDAPVPVPAGTRITLRAYGDPGEFSLAENVAGTAAQDLAAAAPGISSATIEVRRDGSVALRRGERNLGEWSFLVEPDAPPEISMAGEVEQAPTGETRLAFEARDDYGIAGAVAEIDLDLAATDRRYGLAVAPEPRPAISVALPLPMSGGATEIAETLVEDFSKHPWMGLPVTITLVAEDAIGQSGRSEQVTVDLPGRRFFHPLAAAVVEQRRDLLWSVENGRRVTQVLRAVSHRPEAGFDSARAYLVLRTAIRRLAQAVEGDRVAEARDEIAEALWMAALILEEGSLGDAAERLARAKERLAEALRGDASDEEIAQLMDELREAARDYMEQMAREALERGEMQSAEIPPDAQTMSQDQIQELMDRIQELSDQGRRAEAEALLEMLQQMLENMQMMLAEGQPGEGQGGEGQQSMQGLADALREQQGLADESFQQLQREFREGMQQGEGQDTPGRPGGTPGGSHTGEMSLAERQEALRELMEQLQQGLPGSAGEETREALREAERNMGAARDGLEGGETAEALDRQAEAIDNLRQGMRNLSEDMRQAQTGEGGQGQADGQAQSDMRNDPLGRPLGSRGSLGTNQRLLPDGDAAARAREILDEIRRRSGDMSRPDVELDYLRRLLDRF